MGRPPLCYEAKRSKGDITAIIIIKTEDVFLILFAGFAVKVRCLVQHRHYTFRWIFHPYTLEAA